MAREPQTLDEALMKARDERMAASSYGPQAKMEMTAGQIADALIEIKWALTGIMTQLSRGE